MLEYSPEQIQRWFMDAFNAADIEALVALYEPDAALIPQPGQEAHGKEQIRAALEGFLALNGQMTFDNVVSMAVDDIAYLIGKWSLNGTGPDGNPITLGGTTAEVARRQADGAWLDAIDNPWGDQAAG